jgi:hypothetical protein
MHKNTKNFTPALGKAWLTPLYDLAIAQFLDFRGTLSFNWPGSQRRKTCFGKTRGGGETIG